MKATEKQVMKMINQGRKVMQKMERERQKLLVELAEALERETRGALRNAQRA